MEQENLSMGQEREFNALYSIRELTMLFCEMLEEGHGHKSEALSAIKEIAEGGMEGLMGPGLFSRS